MSRIPHPNSKLVVSEITNKLHWYRPPIRLCKIDHDSFETYNNFLATVSPNITYAPCSNWFLKKSATKACLSSSVDHSRSLPCNGPNFKYLVVIASYTPVKLLPVNSSHPSNDCPEAPFIVRHSTPEGPGKIPCVSTFHWGSANNFGTWYIGLKK